MEDIGIPYFFFTIFHWNFIPFSAMFLEFLTLICRRFGKFRHFSDMIFGISYYGILDIGISDTFGLAYSLDFYTFSNLLTQEGIEDIGIPDTFGHAYSLDFYIFSHLLTQEGIEDTGIP